MKTFVDDKYQQLLKLNENYPALLPTITFVGGFVFDIFTLSRIDELFGILQQIAYLIACFLLLGSLFHRSEYDNPNRPKLTKILTFRTEALHFALGALLSVYTLFYFKSSSFAVSSLFLLILTILLVANEVPYFQNMGLGVKSALLALCTLSFFAYVIPILGGWIGPFIFLASMAIGALVLSLMFLYLRRLDVDFEVLKKQALLPWGIVLLVFVGLYFLKILPPVPLSLQHIGVYHSVEKTPEDKYKLGYYKPWWRFWSEASQHYEATEGDQLIVFFRLFAPANFSEQVRLQWSRQLPSGVWEQYDSIPIKITGGRGEGFRGFGLKNNYTEGSWRTRVLTSDGREIGRIGFEVESVSEHTQPMKFTDH